MSAAAAKGQVGIIGLGIMGGAIAKNLAAAGWQVIGFDIDASALRRGEAAGVEIADDAAAVAAKATNILVSLPKPEALTATVDALAAAKLPRRVIAELSTFSLDDKTQAEAALRAAGHVMLDCPLSGTGSQARTKDLVVYASGDAQAINGLMPVFADFSRQAHDLGAFGNGMKMKFVANLLVAIHNVASAEAMVLGMKAGLDPAQIFKLIQSGAGNSRVFELRAPMMVEDRYDGDNLTMRISTWQKDMKVIGEYAASVGCPTPLFSASEPIYRAALSTGYARAGHRQRVRGAGGDGGRQAMTAAHAKSATACASTGIVPITMDDGLVLRADVFRPIEDGQLSRHPHLRPLREGPRVPGRLSERVAAHGARSIPTSRRARPTSIRAGKWSTRRNGCRTAMPACASIRAAPAARPAIIDHFSPRETKDFYDCIEWAGVQPWSNGKVGLNGISYYGINQWHVASLQPPHLAAMCVWEGAADWYRDMTHHGGMLSTFWANWYDMQVKTVQYGAGERGKRSARARRTGVRAGDAERGAAGEEPLRLRRRDPRASARRRLSQGALAAVGQDHGAAVLGRELGRTGPASARQFRGLRARRLEGQVARGARHRALDAFLHRLRPRAAAQVLRLFPEGRGHWLGQAAARAAAGAPSGRDVRRARRERMADRAHAMDEALSRTRRTSRWSRPRSPAKRESPSTRSAKASPS